MIIIDVITAFADNFFLNNNFFIYKKALDKKIIKINIHNLKKYASKNKIDNKIYGSEYGMLYKFKPFDNILRKIHNNDSLIIYPSPTGIKFDNNLIEHIINCNKRLIFLCDRYEGTDCRLIQYYNPLMISLGDYIVSNGELASIVILDSIIRKLILNNKVIDNESFEKKNNFLLDNFHFTYPRKIMNMNVPQMLLSGNHKKIKNYLLERQFLNTLVFREDILLKNDFFINMSIDQKRIIINKIIFLLKLFKRIIKNE